MLKAIACLAAVLMAASADYLGPWWYTSGWAIYDKVVMVDGGAEG